MDRSKVEFSAMNSPKLFRVAALLAAGVIAPLLFTQCKTSASKTYKDVSYDPAKLKTPTGHGMDRKNYPFDEQGNYRKDWVKSNASGRDRSASPGASPAPQLAETESAAPASTTYPTYAEASAALAGAGNSAGSADASGAMTLASAPSSGGGAPAASAPATPPPASYHKVSSGDTLFALANRYSTSVSELKRVNGLSGDSIRVGQSLRLP